MASNVLLFGWNRSIAGRERQSAQHFDDFSKYLTGLQHRGVIQSFEIVLLDPHGGDLNGFFMLRGDPSLLDTLVGTSDWQTHSMRALLHLEGFGAVRGVTGPSVTDRMQLWTKTLPG